MKKRSTKRASRKVTRVVAPKPQSLRDYLIIIKGWMFIVVFAMMLGLGALLGTFINEQLNQSSPQVAGASTSR